MGKLIDKYLLNYHVPIVWLATFILSYIYAANIFIFGFLVMVSSYMAITVIKILNDYKQKK
jgi:hypothetical protein